MPDLPFEVWENVFRQALSENDTYQARVAKHHKIRQICRTACSISNKLFYEKVFADTYYRVNNLLVLFKRNPAVRHKIRILSASFPEYRRSAKGDLDEHGEAYAYFGNEFRPQIKVTEKSWHSKVMKIVRACPQLQSIHLARGHESAVEPGPGQSFLNIRPLRQSILHLHLSGPRTVMHHTQWISELRQLQTLAVTFSNEGGRSQLEEKNGFSPLPPSLRTLRICDPHHQRRLLPEMFDTSLCTQLSEVHFASPSSNNIHDTVVSTLSTTCHSLVKLTLQTQYTASDSFAAVFQEHDLRFPKLKILHLTGGTYTTSVFGILPLDNLVELHVSCLSWIGRDVPNEKGWRKVMLPLRKAKTFTMQLVDPCSIPIVTRVCAEIGVQFFGTTPKSWAYV